MHTVQLPGAAVVPVKGAAVLTDGIGRYGPNFKYSYHIFPNLLEYLMKLEGFLFLHRGKIFKFS